MPGYISHAIMGEGLYNEANRRGNILKTAISKDELKGYSLGADLAVLSKKTIKDPHDFYTRDFFLYLVKYIKNNKLIENEKIMVLLYGHMAHYFFDINAHPLIYYIEQSCQRVGFLSTHDLVEGYLSSYLCREILNKDIMDVKVDYFNKITLSDCSVIKILNDVYGQIYRDYNIIKSYRDVISLFTVLENVIKSGFVSRNMLIFVSQFNLFLKKNNLTLEEIVNANHEVFTNPVTGEICNKSFLELYNRSIDMSLDAINSVNMYLYDDTSIDSLYEIFKNLSYNTGVDCSLGTRYVYVRKKGK